MTRYYDRDQKKFVTVATDNPLPVSIGATPENPLPVTMETQGPSTELYTDTIAATDTPAALAADQPVSWVFIQNDEDAEGGEILYIGNNQAQPLAIPPGKSVLLHVANLNLIYVKAETEAAMGSYFAGN